MQMIIRTIAILGFLFYAVIGSASKNLLVCEIDSRAEKYIRCQIYPFQFTEKWSYEITLKVNYSFKCDSLDLNNIVVMDKSSLAYVSLNTEVSEQEFRINGQGPFILFDRDPEWTRFLHLDLNCELVINKISVFPSANTLNQWKERLSKIETDLAQVEKNIKNLKRLQNTHKAFLLINNLAEFFLRTINDEEVAFISSQSKVLEKLIRDEIKVNINNYSSYELEMRAKLIATLSRMSNRSEWIREDGSLKSIPDFLSQDDLTLMVHLFPSENNEHDQEYERELAELDELKKKLKEEKASLITLLKEPSN